MIFFFLFFIFLFAAPSSYASTASYLVTQGFENTYPYTSGYVFLYKNTYMNYQSGDIVLSSTPDGTGNVNIGDTVKFGIQSADTTLPLYFIHYGEEQCIIFHPSSSPLNITHLFKKGKQHNAGVYLMNWCPTKKTISPLYIVNINIKDDPDPAPFLDLPWDYKLKNMSFTDAAMSMASYFDHEYPLLSSGLAEPKNSLNSVISYKDKSRNYDLDYSSHDGYDYSSIANVHMDEPVLAAASGYASYIDTCSACGNMILIDHQNDYQTRYMHMQNEGLITDDPDQKIWVNARQTIGKVGATGNVWPQGEKGAHIHFSVVYDKNHDGSFIDNIPDGMIDPFGWQSREQDPWETYSFFLNEEEKKNNISRSGSKSYYLWTNQLLKGSATLGKNGGLFGLVGGRYSLTFPQGVVSQDLVISLSVEPIISEPSAQLRPIGAGLVITVTDLVGNIISSFTKNFTIKMIYKGLDTSDINIDSIALYSSQDGINWNKELTTAHDTTNNILSATLNHLTLFALMAERKDIIPPTTHVALTGEKYTDSTYLSSTIVTLTSTDNEGGMGIDYTLIKDDTHDWNRYTTPLLYTDEGHHTLSYYSVDKGGNVEKMQTIFFDIINALPAATPTPAPTIAFSTIPTPTIIPVNMPLPTSTPTPIIATSDHSLLSPTPAIPSVTTLVSLQKNPASIPIKEKPIIAQQPNDFPTDQHTEGSILGADKTSKTKEIKKKNYILFIVWSVILFCTIAALFFLRHCMNKRLKKKSTD